MALIRLRFLWLQRLMCIGCIVRSCERLLFLIFWRLFFSLVLPRIMPFSFGVDAEDPLQYGEHATLQCSVVEGDLPLKITWVFHGRELSSQEGIETTRLGKRANILSIESVSAAHTGNYTCVATNAAGASNYTAELVVQGEYKLE